MAVSAVDLKEFYDSPGGRMVQRILRAQLRRLWPAVRGERIVAMGYGLPYLKPFAAEAERVAALMPRDMGAVFWPFIDKNKSERGLVGLCDAGEWPIETNSVDKCLLIHGIEDAHAMDAALAEAWRVLKGQGSLIVIAPNRTGLWARFDNTPFGHGTPWSMGQLRQALKDNYFVPEKTSRALYVPPSSSRLLLSTAPLWEKIGQKLFAAFGGVNIIESTKQLYAGLPVSTAPQRRRINPQPKPTPHTRGQS